MKSITVWYNYLIIVMESLPLEIFENELLNRVESLHHLSCLNKSFKPLCEKVVKGSDRVKDVKRAILRNDAYYVLRSNIEGKMYELFIFSCKAKKRSFAMYFKGFLNSFDTSYYYYLDDPSLLKVNKNLAIIHGAVKMLSTICDPDDHIEVYLNDLENVKRLYKPGSDLLPTACKFGSVEVVKWLLDQGETNIDMFQICIRDDVELFKLVYGRFAYSLDYCSVNILKWLTTQDVTFTQVNLKNCVELGSLKLVRMVCEKIEVTADDVYNLAEYASEEILRYLLTRTAVIVDKLLSSIKKHYQLSYDLLPNDENKLKLACHREDLETVKELYPKYEKSLFNEFYKGSYELLCILYRGESVNTIDVTTLGMVKFVLEKGMALKDVLLNCVLSHYEPPMSIVKYLVEECGARCDKFPHASTVREYIISHKAFSS